MNCSKFFTIAAVAATAVFAANKADAVMGAVNISATATFEVDTVVSEGNDTFKAVKQSFKTADALKLLQKATENSFGGDQGWFTAKGSELVFDPDVLNQEASDWYSNEVFGIFWVTNTSTHNSFRLDGSSEFGYYSFVEFDFTPWLEGFSYGSTTNLNENGVFAGKYVASPYQYSAKILGNATFYIHDDPYDFDYPDNLGSVVFDPIQNYAVVITGPITYSFAYKYNSKSDSYSAKNSFSIKGSGDGLWNDDTRPQGSLPQPVYSGSVKHSDSGNETEDQALLPDPLD